MSDTLNDTLAAMLEAAGLARDTVTAKLAEIAAEYPEAAAATDALSQWLTGALAGTMTPGAIEGIVLGAVAEIQSGHPGFNPHAGGVA